MLDFCIIGAPKSGTTSLFNWLDAHPKLEGAIPKETHFLMDPGHPLCGIRGADYHTDGPLAYSRFFSEAHSNQLRFEATTQYFYQKTARDYLTSLQPQPTIIILLREPADRILSSFRFTRDNLAYCEHSLTFDHYVECLLDNRLSELDPYYHASDSLYIAKRELKLSCYAQWLNWWLERLDRQRLEIIAFDELKHNPSAVMKHLCNRLGINPEFYQDFDYGQANATYPVGNQLVHRILRPAGLCIPGGRVKAHLKTMYLDWQRRKATPDNNYKDGVQALREYFMPANQTLAKEYSLNLDSWTQ